ncbi:unnamed protein product [Camellia sinensis]
MSFGNSSSKRTQSDSEPEIFSATKHNQIFKFNCSGKSLKSKVLSRVFSEDFEKVKKKTIIDPRGRFVRGWSNVFLATCLVSLFFDPIFFFVLKVDPELCVETGVLLEIVLTVIRSITDLFFIVNIVVKFRTAYVAPSSRVFGRGELVIDPWKITARYIRKDFWFDVLAALPVPQVLIWGIIPNLKGSMTSNFKTSLWFVMMIQYLPRLFVAYPLSIQIAKATGIVTEAAWLGAAYNLMLYLLSSHIMGSCGYLLSVQREAACWRSLCDEYNTTCNYEFFECNKIRDLINSTSRDDWIQASSITDLCNPNNGSYPYGIYNPGVGSGLTTAGFFSRYFYALWFGLRSVSTTGQNLTTSIFIGENIYCTVIVMLGLTNMAFLIGNMQRYIQSTTVRIEEWRVKKSDKEQWMHHRQLPQELREKVRRYDRYKWVATQGVNEEALLTDLPKDLRRRIKRHLSLNLVRRVPLLDEIDDRLLDSICERLKPSLWTEGMFIVREGDPLEEMIFIIRGHLYSYTTNGGQVGFFNSCQLGPTDFCGDELLTWALKTRPADTLPSSTRTIKTISDVEAFALGAEDLKFVASQFHRLHSKRIRHKYRFYSHQWRTWGACFIQAAWRRYRKRKALAELNAKEGGGGGGGRSPVGLADVEMMMPQPGSGLAEYAAMIISSIRSKRYGESLTI